MMSLRRYALPIVVAGALVLAGRHGLAALILVILAAHLLVSILAPRWADAIGRAFMKIVHAISRAIGYVLLLVAYVFLILPWALVSRLFGRHQLDLRHDLRSTWKTRKTQWSAPVDRPFTIESADWPLSRTRATLRALKLALALLFLVAVLDYGAGFLVHNRGVVTGLFRANDEVQDDVPGRETERAIRSQFEPYVLWRNRNVEGEFYNVRDGLRLTYQPRTATSGARTIYMFGGSTLWGYGAADDHTIPSELARAIENANLDWRVVNYGQPAYVTWQDVMTLARLCADGQAPAMAVFYGAFNDVFTRVAEPHEDRPIWDGGWWRRSFDRIMAGSPAPPLEDWWSTYKKHSFTTSALRRVRGRYVRSQDQADDALPALGDSVASVYAGNREVAIALGAHYGFDVVFVWQPTLATREPWTDAETAAYHRGGTQDVALAEVYRAATARVREQDGVIDLSDVLDGRTDAVFTDAAHVTQAANRTIAEALFLQLRPRLERTATP